MTLYRAVRACAIVIAVAGAILGLHSAFEQYENYANIGYVNPVLPQAYLHANIDDGQTRADFHAGDAMYLHTEVRRKVECSVDSNYRILSEYKSNDVYHRVVWHMYSATRTKVAAGMYISDVRLIIPDWLKPGDYLLDRNASYSCANNRIEGSSFIPFKVVAAEHSPRP